MSDYISQGKLLNGAVLDTIVPHASDANLEEALDLLLHEDAGDSPFLLPTVKQRTLLFFDELVTVHVVLRLSNCSENALKTQLPRLSVQLEAFVVGDSAPTDGTDDDSRQSKDLVFSGVANNTEDPLVVVNEFDIGEGTGNNLSPGSAADVYVYVIWKVDAFLSRPRVRLQNPLLVFSASATLSPPKAPPEAYRDGYLPTLLPASANVFQPLSIDLPGKQSHPYLPASRLLRVVPSTQTEGPLYSIQQQSHNPIRIIPIASSRIRYSRLNTYSRTPTTIASVDFEVTPFTHFEVILEEVHLNLSDGDVENLTRSAGFSPPITCLPRDDLTFVYKLTPKYGLDPTPSTTAIICVLDISLRATILVSDECRPKISMQWTTNVDFSLPLNTTFGGPSHVLQRSIRPSNLPMAPTPGTSTPTPGTLPLNRRAYFSADIDVTISFSGPVNVEVGKAFHWDIFIVNRSGKARKFAMAAVPRRKRTDSRKHAARPSSSSVFSRKEDQVAEAVTDENIVYAMQKNATPYETDLICLSTDIRVGPLLPGTCHSTELKLLPLAEGPLHVEAVKLVDLNTNDTMDIRDLPDIMAFHKGSF